MTPVGFEPTPLRTGALSQRLRPLGQSVPNVSCTCAITSASNIATHSAAMCVCARWDANNATIPPRASKPTSCWLALRCESARPTFATRTHRVTRNAWCVGHACAQAQPELGSARARAYWADIFKLAVVRRGATVSAARRIPTSGRRAVSVHVDYVENACVVARCMSLHMLTRTRGECPRARSPPTRT